MSYAMRQAANREWERAGDLTRAEYWAMEGERALPDDDELLDIAMDTLETEDAALRDRIESCRAATGSATLCIWALDDCDRPDWLLRVDLTADMPDWRDAAASALRHSHVPDWMRDRLDQPWTGQQYGDDWDMTAVGPWYLSAWDDPDRWGHDSGGLACVVLPTAIAHATDNPIDDAPINADMDAGYHGWRHTTIKT